MARRLLYYLFGAPRGEGSPNFRGRSCGTAPSPPLASPYPLTDVRTVGSKERVSCTLSGNLPQLLGSRTMLKVALELGTFCQACVGTYSP